MTGDVAECDQHRIVLLGASNLTLGWPQLMREVFARYSEPLKVLTAHGMGRSYIAESGFGWRTAPGILECGLCDTLSRKPVQRPLNALITDLGNDIVYGRTAEAVANAAGEVIDRLRLVSPDAHIVLTRPPRDSVESLSEMRFRIFRTLLFPICSLSLVEIVNATTELDERLQELRTRTGVAIVEQPGAWFGFDPIHIRRRWRRYAFSQMAEEWPDGTLIENVRRDVPHRRPTMAERKVCGRLRSVEQPSVRSRHGHVSAW